MTSIEFIVNRNEFGRLASRLRSRVADASQETAEAIVEDAKQRVPVDTGELRDSIDARSEGIGYIVEATAGHAGFVEYGTRRMAAQPYLTPAAEAQRAPFIERLKRALE